VVVQLRTAVARWCFGMETCRPANPAPIAERRTHLAKDHPLTRTSSYEEPPKIRRRSERDPAEV